MSALFVDVWSNNADMWFSLDAACRGKKTRKTKGGDGD